MKLNWSGLKFIPTTEIRVPPMKEPELGEMEYTPGGEGRGGEGRGREGRRGERRGEERGREGRRGEGRGRGGEGRGGSRGEGRGGSWSISTRNVTACVHDWNLIHALMHALCSHSHYAVCMSCESPQEWLSGWKVIRFELLRTPVHWWMRCPL